MTTVTDGTTTLEPLLVVGYASARDSRNVFHDLLGRADVDASLRPAGLRTGTLTFLVATLADGLAFESLHAQAATLTLTDTDLPGLDMLYAARGTISISLDEETQVYWTVAVDFQELAP